MARKGGREEAAAAVAATVIHQALLQKLKGPKVEGREGREVGAREGRRPPGATDAGWIPRPLHTALSLDANETQRHRRRGTVHLAPTQKVRGDILPSAASTLANAIASLA